MTKMKAVGFYKHLPIDHEESLLDVLVEKPKPEGKDLLVLVKAIGVNPVDYKIRKVGENEEEPKILGWDVAGVVEEAGEECTLFKPGDEVYYAGDVRRPGGNSQFHLVDEQIVGKKPKTLSFAEAAAMPLTTITAYESLFERLQISKNPENNEGKVILVIGAAGGVGSIATQLAKNAGLTVVGTASRPITIDWAKSHGTDYILNHYEAFGLQLEELGFKTVDFILCLHATDEHWKNMAYAISPQGKICSIVENIHPIKLGLLKDKSASFVWEFMFTRTKYQTKDFMEQGRILNEVADQIDSQRLKNTMNELLSPINAKNLRRAHEMLESGKTIGKIVLERF